MALILYTANGLKELLNDLANQFENELNKNDLLASVEIEVNGQDETWSFDIRTFSNKAVDNYKEVKQKTEQKQAVADRLMVVRDHKGSSDGAA